MQIDYTSKGHFHQRVAEYLDHIKELEAYSYSELAKQITSPIARVTLLSGETYMEVRLNGVEYGLGYIIKNNITYIKTAISPMDVERARSRSFRCKREVLDK